jgi:peptide/nickel transport system ATP-binding protein
LLLISHDLAIVRHVADRVAVMYLGTIVEEAVTEQLWHEPFHPYTEALIHAVPHADGTGSMPDGLAGEVPDPAQPPSGCRFHPRCPHAFDRCHIDVPALEQIAPDRVAACLLQADGPPMRASAKALARSTPQQVVADA